MDKLVITAITGTRLHLSVFQMKVLWKWTTLFPVVCHCIKQQPVDSCVFDSDVFHVTVRSRPVSHSSNIHSSCFLTSRWFCSWVYCLCTPIRFHCFGVSIKDGPRRACPQKVSQQLQCDYGWIVCGVLWLRTDVRRSMWTSHTKIQKYTSALFIN